MVDRSIKTYICFNPDCRKKFKTRSALMCCCHQCTLKMHNHFQHAKWKQQKEDYYAEKARRRVKRGLPPTPISKDEAIEYEELQSFKKQKIEVLKDFGIKITPQIKTRINNCKSKYEIDRVGQDYLHRL